MYNFLLIPQQKNSLHVALNYCMAPLKNVTKIMHTHSMRYTYNVMYVLKRQLHV